MGHYDAFKARCRSIGKSLSFTKTGDHNLPPELDDMLSGQRSKYAFLKILSKEIDWQVLQDDNNIPGANICWALQLTFLQLRLCEDVDEISQILTTMRKLTFEKALKRYNVDCPGLSTMIEAVHGCCIFTNDGNQDIENLTPEKLKQISTNCVHICRSLLLPYAKRSRGKKLYTDGITSISKSLEIFACTLEKYSSLWPEDISEHLDKTVTSVVSVIKSKEELEDEIINKNFITFTQQIPKSLTLLSQKHPETWLSSLRTLCEKGPQNNAGTLCRLWTRIVVTSPINGFKYLRNIVEQTYETIWTQYEAQPTSSDLEFCENIIGCIHGLIEQCCGRSKNTRHSHHWQSLILPTITDYKAKRQNNLEDPSGPIEEYINKSITVISNLPRRRKINDIPPKEQTSPVKKSEDTFYGLV